MRPNDNHFIEVVFRVCVKWGVGVLNNDAMKTHRSTITTIQANGKKVSTLSWKKIFL